MAKSLKIVIVGQGGVGKSSLTIRFTENKFQEDYNPTIEDTYRKTLVVDGEEYTLNILDTAGQEEYAVLRDQYNRTGDGFIFVYDLTNAATFADIKTMRNRVLRAKDVEWFPCVVAANKVDLAAAKRQVQESDAAALAADIRSPFFETSAKTNIHVDNCFAALVRSIRDGDVSSKGETTKEKSGSSWKFWKKSSK
eukprot:ANDGO_04483.mRNA.1 Ras-like protein rasC